MGATLAKEGLGLVYGGGRVGLMGVVADAALAEGGRVVGVIPDPLAVKELAHTGLTELHVVAGMHERKALMARLSAGFLTLPGGIGTFEEFFEILSWAALGLHRKPIGILNVDGYFDPLLTMLEHGVKEGIHPPRVGRHRDHVLQPGRDGRRRPARSPSGTNTPQALTPTKPERRDSRG